MNGHREMYGAIERVQEILYLRGIRRPEVIAEAIVDNLLENNEVYSAKQIEEQIKVHQEQYRHITEKYLKINAAYNDLLRETELHPPFYEAVEFLLKEIEPLISQAERTASTTLQQKAERSRRAHDLVEYLLDEAKPHDGEQQKELL